MIQHLVSHHHQPKGATELTPECVAPVIVDDGGCAPLLGSRRVDQASESRPYAREGLGVREKPVALPTRKSRAGATRLVREGPLADVKALAVDPNQGARVSRSLKGGLVA